MALQSFFDDLLPRFEFFLPSFDVLLPLVDFLLPIIMSWLHVYPHVGDDPGIRIKTALKNSAACCCRPRIVQPRQRIQEGQLFVSMIYFRNSVESLHI